MRVALELHTWRYPSASTLLNPCIYQWNHISTMTFNKQFAWRLTSQHFHRLVNYLSWLHAIFPQIEVCATSSLDCISQTHYRKDLTIFNIVHKTWNLCPIFQMFYIIKYDPQIHATSNMNTVHKLAPLPRKFINILKLNIFPSDLLEKWLPWTNLNP